MGPICLEPLHYLALIPFSTGEDDTSRDIDGSRYAEWRKLYMAKLCGRIYNAG